MLRILVYAIVGLPVLVIILHTIVRIVRFFYKFPMPQFLANVIDNPLRRKIQPPDETPIRHGIEPGMTVLEVGPGNGTYTVATARRVGNKGKVVTIDIEPKMIEQVTRRAQAEGIENIEARVADVYDLPFEEGSFDAIYMIAVIGEIPAPEKAMKEFYRVLSPSGTLAFSELLPDPDYPRARTLIQKAASAGFRLKKKVGNFFYYTLIFEKELRFATSHNGGLLLRASPTRARQAKSRYAPAATIPADKALYQRQI
jgi:ubiquinone/menaquinone biosynthesis C-methylase UbiE